MAIFLRTKNFEPRARNLCVQLSRNSIRQLSTGSVSPEVGNISASTMKLAINEIQKKVELNPKEYTTNWSNIAGIVSVVYLATLLYDNFIAPSETIGAGLSDIG
jgi:hypothetical protein